MDVEQIFIKPILSFLYSKGMSEIEAYEEVKKQYGPLAISLRSINKWFSAFKPKNPTSINNREYNLKPKFSDEFLINLINENPSLNLKELGKLTGCSGSAISNRLKKINKDGERVNYSKKSFNNTIPIQKPLFTDKFLIDLVNENPELSMSGLAKLANCSRSTILVRLSQINSDGKNSNYAKKNSNVCILKFTDEFLINLITRNPELNAQELAKLANCSKATILNRIKLINSDSTEELKISLQNDASKSLKKFDDELLVNLINERPELSMRELAAIIGTSQKTISTRLKKINSNGERVKYTNKNNLKSATKFTDEYLINLVNENPDLNLKELAKLANSSAVTISKRLEQINSEGERVAYCKKDYKKGKTKITDESIIDLIKENPELNMKELARLSNISESTICKRIQQINSRGIIVNYCKKGYHKDKATNKNYS